MSVRLSVIGSLLTVIGSLLAVASAVSCEKEHGSCPADDGEESALLQLRGSTGHPHPTFGSHVKCPYPNSEGVQAMCAGNQCCPRSTADDQPAGQEGKTYPCSSAREFFQGCEYKPERPVATPYEAGEAEEDEAEEGEGETAEEGEAEEGTGLLETTEDFPPSRGESFEPPYLNAWEYDKKPIHLFARPLTMTIPGADRPFVTRGWATEADSVGSPAPTIRVRPGDVLRIKLVNELTAPNPDCSGTPNDFSYYFCNVNTTNIHTHGLHVSPKRGSDDIFESVEPGNSSGYEIALPDFHMGGSFWYHAHHHHSTSVQAGGGMLGALIVEDPAGTLPPHVAKMPEVVVFMTWVDTTKDSVLNNTVFEYEDNLLSSAPTLHQALVNGQYQPEKDIYGGKWYRFRMIFASVAHTLQVGTGKGNALCEIQLLAKDGVYLNVAPRKIRAIYLASGSRADVALRCACPPGMESCSIEFGSFPAAYVSGAEDNTSSYNPFSDVKMFRATKESQGLHQTTINQVLFTINVKARWRRDPDLRRFRLARPCYLVDLRWAGLVAEVQEHDLGLQTPVPDYNGIHQDGLLSLDGNGESMHMAAETPPFANLSLLTVQQFNLGGVGVYAGGIAFHPYHLHVTPFQLQNVHRWARWFGYHDRKHGAPWSEDVEFENYFESGDWHDVILHNQGNMSIRFQLSTFTGRYVNHCHLLEHEDEGMMNYFDVRAPEGHHEGDWWRPAKKIDPQCYESAAVRDGMWKKWMYTW